MEHTPANVRGRGIEILGSLFCDGLAPRARPAAVAVEAGDGFGDLLPDATLAEETEELVTLFVVRHTLLLPTARRAQPRYGGRT